MNAADKDLQSNMESLLSMNSSFVANIVVLYQQVDITTHAPTLANLCTCSHTLSI